jgi:hypothetical protein
MDRTVTFKQDETSSHEPQLGLDTKTDYLTVSRNVTLTCSGGLLKKDSATWSSLVSSLVSSYVFFVSHSIAE